MYVMSCDFSPTHRLRVFNIEFVAVSTFSFHTRRVCFLKVLLVCNAGLTTEASYDLLFETFSPHGCVAEVRMMPGKSFSFIAFADQAGAVAAMEAVHGVQGRFLGKVLYLAYCDRMPPEPEGEGGRWRSQENWPGGLRLISDFVDDHEEELLLRSVRQENVHQSKNRPFFS